jgi:hypothetical protein
MAKYELVMSHKTGKMFGLEMLPHNISLVLMSRSVPFPKSVRSPSWTTSGMVRVVRTFIHTTLDHDPECRRRFTVVMCAATVSPHRFRCEPLIIRRNLVLEACADRLFGLRHLTAFSMATQDARQERRNLGQRSVSPAALCGRIWSSNHQRPHSGVSTQVHPYS